MENSSNIAAQLNSFKRTRERQEGPQFLPTPEQIEAREKELQAVEKNLRAQFAGLDQQITQILNYVRPWYLLPQAQRRPTVISLWGMTGVGKSSFVKAFVEAIHAQNRFVEVDLGKLGTERSGHYHNSDVPTRLYELSETNCVIFLDEMHNARTIAQNGTEISRPSMADFWPLLDNGILTQQTYSASQIMRGFKSSLRMLSERPDYASPQLDEEYCFFLMTFLGLDCTSDEMIKLAALDMKAFYEWAIAELKAAVENAKPLDYSQSLIFVASNLDEAFSNVDRVNPDDMNADDLHTATSALSVDTIKQCLLARFRPEQVARLGSLQVVFPSLSREAFETLISRRLHSAFEWVNTKFDLHFSFEKSLVDLVLSEGVVPSQGARPVLSTISEMIESKIPGWIVEAKRSGQKKFVVRFLRDEKKLVVVGSVELWSEVMELRRDKLPKVTLSASMRRVIAVHEAGHAVVGIVLEGRLPLKILAGSLAFHRGGPRVMFAPEILTTKAHGRQTLAVGLGGFVAEHMVFGAENVSLGSTADLANATSLAAKMISCAGVGEHLSVSLADAMSPQNTVTFKERDDKMVEKWMQQAREEAEHCLKQQRRLFTAICEELFERERLSRDDLAELVRKHYAGPKKDVAAIVRRQQPRAIDDLNARAKLKAAG